MAVTRKSLQELARIRLEDGSALLRAGRYDGAYYVLGLAVECALKSCIARRVRRHDFPDKELAVQSYSHDLTKLVRVAGLETALDGDKDAVLRANWLIVRNWSIDARYSKPGQRKALALNRAMNDRDHGVMKWIRRRW